MDLRRGATTAHSCIFITSCCTSVCTVPMAALGKGGGARGSLGPAGAVVQGRSHPRSLETAPNPMAPCLYRTLRHLSQPNLETLENKRKGALKVTEHTHLTGGEVEAQSRGK